MASVTLPWVPVYAELPTHRKSIRLETQTGIARAWTHVVELWLWCARNRPDGHIGDMPESMVAEICHWPRKKGLLQALQDAEFLDEDGYLHDWDEHVTQYLQKREGNRERQQRKRERERDARQRRDDGVTVTGHVTRDKRDSHAPTGPDRTGSDQDPPNPPEGGERAGARGGEASETSDALTADRTKYEQRYRELFGSPHAELTSRGRRAYASMHAKHGPATLLRSLDRLARDPHSRTWDLDRCCSQSGIDRGARNDDADRGASVSPYKDLTNYRQQIEERRAREAQQSSGAAS